MVRPHGDGLDALGSRLRAGRRRAALARGAWGDWIEFDSLINVRPAQGNRSRNVDDPVLQVRIRQVVTTLVEG